MYLFVSSSFGHYGDVPNGHYDGVQHEDNYVVKVGYSYCERVDGQYDDESIPHVCIALHAFLPVIGCFVEYYNALVELHSNRIIG